MQIFDFLKNINTNDTFGYKERSPYPSEMNYFKQNPLVGGMATEDNKITLNPYSGLTRQQKNAIKQNEATRLYLRENANNYPQFSLTPEQNNYFNNNLNYSQNPVDIQHTILGRILSGDSSAQNITPQQQDVANQVHLDMQKRLNKYFGI